MLFQSALLILAVALPVVFASVDNGIYRIISAKSGTSVRGYRNESPLYVSNTLEFPGPFEMFDVRDGENGGQALFSVGLRLPVMAIPEKKGGSVVATQEATRQTYWEISSAGDGLYTIQVVGQDLLWNAEDPVIPRGEVKLQPANGSPTQRWVLQRVDGGLEGLKDNEPTKAEAESEKFGHILGQVLSHVGHELLGN